MSKAEEIIKDFLSIVVKAGIMGKNPLDEAIKSIAPKFSSWQNVVDALVHDCAAYNGDAVQFLKDKCGLSFDGGGKIAGVGVSRLGSVYLDENLVNEIASVVGKANDIVHNLLPQYLEEGLSGLVSGVDDNQRNEIVKVAKNASYLADALQPGAIGIGSYSAGFIVLNYFLRQLSDAVIDSVSATVPDGYILDGNTLVLGSGVQTNVWLEGINLFTGEATYKNDSVAFINGSQIGSNIVLAGNKQDNWILGGSGAESLWGGSAGNDTLQGGSGADIFYLGYGCGADVVPDFAMGVGNESDVLYIYGAGGSSVTRGGRTLTVGMMDGSTLSIDVGPDTNGIIQYALDYGAGTLLARVGNTNEGNSLLYDRAVAFYQGGDSTDALIVSGGGSHDVWLDGRNGQWFDSIEVIDGAASSGEDKLAGNASSNLLIGGSGSQSLWGGIGGDDTIQGGSGRDMFWYGKGNGSDIVINTGTDDVVNLYDISLGDIAYANVSSGEISMGFKGGGSIAVKTGSSSAPSFVLGGDNSRWRYDYGTGNWRR